MQYFNALCSFLNASQTEKVKKSRHTIFAGELLLLHMKVKTSENKAQVFFSVLFPKKGLIKKAAWKERETLRPKKRVDFFLLSSAFFCRYGLGWNGFLLWNGEDQNKVVVSKMVSRWRWLNPKLTDTVFVRPYIYIGNKVISKNLQWYLTCNFCKNSRKVSNYPS